MWNDSACYKQTFKFVVFIALILFCFNNFNNKPANKCFATGESEDSVENVLFENTENILGDIDTSELDEFLNFEYEFDFLNNMSFKEIVAGVLSGNYFVEYDGLFDAIISEFKLSLKNVLALVVALLIIVLLAEMFKNFCVDKYSDFKKLFQIIFSMLLILILSDVLQDVVQVVSEVVQKIFKFANILFPIILNLILLSGASGSFSIHSSMSAVLLNSGSYVFVYVLLPLSLSILVLSLVSSLFSSKRFYKTLDVLKTIFKYVIGVMVAVFGLFSVVNLATASAKDGVGLKITKYAIKNYIPILGGYISDGFDFVRAGSVLVKNAFGLCGIIVLFFIIVKPLVLYFVYLLTFKILSVVVTYIGSDFHADVFDNISKSMGYFISVLVGVFLIMFIFVYLTISSVSVV